MEVILLERVAKLGQMGDVVRVKDGFARNFLLPKGKALRATEENRSRFENMKVDLEARNLEQKGEAEKVAQSSTAKASPCFAKPPKAGNSTARFRPATSPIWSARKALLSLVLRLRSTPRSRRLDCTRCRFRSIRRSRSRST